MTSPSAPHGGSATPARAVDPLAASLAESHPDGVLMLDREGRPLVASGVWRGGPDAFLERAKWGDALAAALRGDATTLDLETASLPRRTARVLVGPLRSSGVVNGAIAFATDITDRVDVQRRLERSERLMTDTQGTAHMGTWEWDLSQPHAWWSDELYRIYGLTPQQYTPSYEGYLKMVHPDDRERVMKATDRVFHEHVPYSHDERIFRPNGEMRFLHTWAHPVLDDEGKLTRLVGVCQDVTEQRLAEAAVRTQTMARGLVRRLVLDLVRQSRVSERALRDLGRGLALEQQRGERVEPYVQAFVDMGLGELRVEPADDGRLKFVGSDLLERQAEATLPTCAMTLGYLEGVVGLITGHAALGTEMRCQSTGAHECVFVVRTQAQG